MTIDTTPIGEKYPDNIEFTELADVLVRVETSPLEGWTYAGRPIAEWADLALLEAAASEYLARKVAELEGLQFPSDEWISRTTELQNEARKFAQTGR